MELQNAPTALLQAKAPRVLSVDVLRGITMFTMVFVNDAYGAQNSPWWLKHWSDLPKSFGPSGMTFVDVVFPAFLFIVGMSIPIAIENRRVKGDRWLTIFAHILIRTLSLLFLGILMVNSPSDKTMGWPSGLWKMLMYSGALVTFHWLPLKNKQAKYISWSVRALGFALLIFLAFKFRNRHGGTLEHSWWGILGLIGWAYFGATTLYLLLRKEGLAALVAGVALCMCVYAGERSGAFNGVNDWLAIGDAFGSQTAITMAGVVIGSMLLPTSERQTPGSRMRFACVFAILMCVGALILNQYGISKNAATPSWCLWSAAITTALWVVLYAIIDVAGWRAWSIPPAWAGASALMIYILSEGWDIFHERVSWLQWDWYDKLGESYPHSLYHKFLTAAVISLFAGVVGRVGFKLKL
jgi:predicted acyltransferase